MDVCLRGNGPYAGDAETMVVSNMLGVNSSKGFDLVASIAGLTQQIRIA